MSYIDLPPPFTSGNLHIGHMYGFFISKLLIKIFKLKYKIGFDIHGLPTYLYTLNNINNIDNNNLENNNILSVCKEITNKNIDTMIKELNIYFNFDKNIYTTGDNDYYRKINKLINKFIHEEIIKIKYNYKNYYCDKCETNLMKNETNYIDVKKNIYLLFLGYTNHNTKIIIETTKPEYIFSIKLIITDKDNELLKKNEYIVIFNKKIFILKDINNYINNSIENINNKKYKYVFIGSGSDNDLNILEKYNIVPFTKIYENKIYIKHIKKYISLKYIKENIEDYLKNYNIDIIDIVEISSKSLIHLERKNCLNEISFSWSNSLIIDLSEKDILNIEAIISKMDIYPFYMKKELLYYLRNFNDYKWNILRNCKWGKTIKLDKENKKNKILKKIIKNKTIDCWFETSFTYLINNKNNNRKIIRIQGKDIIRTWLLYTIIANYLNNSKKIDVAIITGLIKKDNIKLSKSNEDKNNKFFINYKDLTKEELALYFINSEIGKDKEIINNTHLIFIRKIINKIKNLKIYYEKYKNILNNKKIIDNKEITNKLDIYFGKLYKIIIKGKKEDMIYFISNIHYFNNNIIILSQNISNNKIYLNIIKKTLIIYDYIIDCFSK